MKKDRSLSGSEELDFTSINEYNARIREEVDKALDNFFAFATDRQLKVEELHKRKMINMRQREDWEKIEINLQVWG